MTTEPLALKRVIIGRLVFTYFFIFLLFRFCINVSPSQLLQPPLFMLNFDFTYWTIKLSGVADLIIQNKTGSILFDLLIFSSCLMCIFYPLKNIWAIVFGVLFFIYAILFNTYAMHHTHMLAIMTLITVPFFVRKPANWNMLWEGMRYYVCYSYVMSFIWKAFIGKSLLQWDMGVNSFKSNLVEYMYHYPDTFLTHVYQYLLGHSALLNIGSIVLFCLEGIMVVGFFTKRFDHLLLLIPIVIHLTTYFFSDVFFFEMLIGVFTFVPFKHYPNNSDRSFRVNYLTTYTK